VPDRTYPALPDGDFGILDAYVGALRGARRLIYLENQIPDGRIHPRGMG
jgi:hypothetical protein